MKSLDEIAISTGTDKSSNVHNYCVKYEKYLPFLRNQSLKILEIGVFNGSSLKMWKEFYTNSTVVGIDINSACSSYSNETENVFVEIGSQIDANFLDIICKKYGPFDIIIDDGSHMQSHMIFSFEHLFNFLKKQGVYIVEDTCCAYWTNFEGGLYKKESSVEYFKSLVDHVNFFGQFLNDYPSHWRREDLHIKQLQLNNPNGCRIDIESINFLNSTILITKK